MHRITKQDLQRDLIRLGTGTGRKVWIYKDEAKKLALSAYADSHVLTDFDSAPEGTLFLHKCDSGTPGWRIRSKGKGSSECDEFYAPTADIMDRCLSAATWVLNLAEGR